MSPEETRLEKLIKWAIRFEKSNEALRNEALKREDRDFKSSPIYKNWGRYQAAETNNDYRTGKSDERKGAQTEHKVAPDRKPQISTNAKPSGQNKGKAAPRSKLSPEERDKMRAEGRCFECKEIGHQSRNCPKRHEAKAPKVSVGAVRYEYLRNVNLDKLTDEKLAAGARVASVSIENSEVDQVKITSGLQDDVWMRAPAQEICQYLERLWMTQYGTDEAIANAMDPDRRFSAIEYHHI